MSHKENDKYFEALQQATEDLHDYHVQLHRAKEDYWESARWMEKMEETVRKAEKHLQDVRDKNI